MLMLKKLEVVNREEERGPLAVSYLISNLFEAESLDECLDVAIKGFSMLDFFQSQINLLEGWLFRCKNYSPPSLGDKVFGLPRSRVRWAKAVHSK